MKVKLSEIFSVVSEFWTPLWCKWVHYDMFKKKKSEKQTHGFLFLWCFFQIQRDVQPVQQQSHDG